MSDKLNAKTLSEAIDVLEKVVEDFKPQVEKVEKQAKKVLDEKPLMTLGITALLFLILGVLLGKSGRR